MLLVALKLNLTSGVGTFLVAADSHVWRVSADE